MDLKLDRSRFKSECFLDLQVTQFLPIRFFIIIMLSISLGYYKIEWDSVFKVSWMYLKALWIFTNPTSLLPYEGRLLAASRGTALRVTCPTWLMRTEKYLNTTQVSKRPTPAATESHSPITEANYKWLSGLTWRRMEAIKKMMRCLLCKINISGSQKDDQIQFKGMWTGRSI